MRQRRLPPGVDRSSVAVSAAAQSQPAIAPAPGETTQSRAGHFLESPTTIASTLQDLDCASQKDGGRGDGLGAGADWIRLGHCLPDARAREAQQTPADPTPRGTRSGIPTGPAQNISEEQISF